MSCGLPSPDCSSMTVTSPETRLIRFVSMSALITKALPVCGRQCRQWQQCTNIGTAVNR